jgi:hypothetical protein
LTARLARHALRASRSQAASASRLLVTIMSGTCRDAASGSSPSSTAITMKTAVVNFGNAAGAKIFGVYTRKGDPAKAEGTWHVVRGTGKLEGITLQQTREVLLAQRISTARLACCPKRCLTSGCKYPTHGWHALATFGTGGNAAVGSICPLRLRLRPNEIFGAPFERGEIGPTLFKAACDIRLEGMVSKRADRSYHAGRSKDWVKIKNRKHPAYRCRISSRGLCGRSMMLFIACFSSRTTRNRA